MNDVLRTGKPITLTQAAELAGVTPRTMRQAAVAGTLEATKLNERLWLTTLSAVERWQATKYKGWRRRSTPIEAGTDSTGYLNGAR